MCCCSMKRLFALSWHALPQGEAHSVRRTLSAWRVICTNALWSYTRGQWSQLYPGGYALRGRGPRQLRAFRVLNGANFTWYFCYSLQIKARVGDLEKTYVLVLGDWSPSVKYANSLTFLLVKYANSPSFLLVVFSWVFRDLVSPMGFVIWFFGFRTCK